MTTGVLSWLHYTALVTGLYNTDRRHADRQDI